MAQLWISQTPIYKLLLYRTFLSVNRVLGLDCINRSSGCIFWQILSINISLSCHFVAFIFEGYYFDGLCDVKTLEGFIGQRVSPSSPGLTMWNAIKILLQISVAAVCAGIFTGANPPMTAPPVPPDTRIIVFALINWTIGFYVCCLSVGSVILWILSIIKSIGTGAPIPKGFAAKVRAVDCFTITGGTGPGRGLFFRPAAKLASKKGRRVRFRTDQEVVNGGDLLKTKFRHG